MPDSTPPSSPLERFAAALAAWEAFLERRRGGGAEPLSAWLAAHAHLGDVLDDVILARGDADSAATAPRREVGVASGADLGGFRLIEEIGRGAHGAVWRARSPDGADVALKLMHASALADGDLRARFGREARVAASLAHDNLCRVVAFDDVGPQPWLAMEFVAGETLAARLLRERGAPIDIATIRRRVELVAQLADGLHHAHEQNLVHRDVKPGNVMVTARGAPVLVDFGLVREGGTAGQLTLTGDRMGTPTYMAPEQVRGERADRRADVWALGVILFESVTGRLPFVAPTHEGIARAILTDGLPPARRLNPSVSANLALVLETALGKRRDDRYATAADLAEELRRWLRGEPVLARRQGVLRRAWRWSERHPVVVLLAALTVALVAVGRLWQLEAWQRAQVEAREAELAFQAARREAGYGRWAAASALYDQASRAYRDPIAIELGRVEIWDATFAADQSAAALARIDARTDLGVHRDMVTLLRHDFSRQMFGESTPSEFRASRDKIAGLRESPHLTPPWREYAKALSADSLLEAREHLRLVLALDRRHRPANEMWGPLVLVLDGPAAALAAAREFGAMFPGDPAPVFVEVLSLRLLGRTAEADARTAAVPLPAAALDQIDLVVAVRDGVRSTCDVMLETVVRMANGGRAPDDVMPDMLRAFFAKLGPLWRKRPDAEEGTVLFRFPLAAVEGMSRALTAVMLFSARGRLQDMDAVIAALPLSAFLAIRGGALSVRGEHRAALADFDRAVAAADDFAGIRHHVEMLRAIKAVGWVASRPTGEDVELARAAAERCIDHVLRAPHALTADELRCLANGADTIGATWRAREILARLAHEHPGDAAAVEAAGQRR